VILSGYPNRLYTRELKGGSRKGIVIDNKASSAKKKPEMMERICHQLTIGDLVTDLSQIAWNHVEKPLQYGKCGIRIGFTVTSQVVPRKQLNDSAFAADRVASGAEG
jgi:hypothetical protein